MYGNSNSEEGDLHDDDQFAKDVCIRASLRLVRTALLKNKKGGRRQQENCGDVEVLPFASLGDPSTLIDLVADTQVGLEGLDDAQNLLNQKETLMITVNELNETIDKIEKDINLKESLVKSLTVNCEEAKKNAKESVVELDEISKRIMRGRKELEKLESDKFIQEKELDSGKKELEELIVLSNLENTTVEGIRETRGCQVRASSLAGKGGKYEMDT